jgi:hypothetical protein
MPRVSEMHPSKYLKASDCEDGDLVLTIERLEQDRIGQGKDAEDKWIVYFVEHDKGLILNKTNTNTIAKLYGDDTDDWEGKPVTLFATEVQFGTDMVDAIRIRSKPAKPKGATKATKATAPAARPAAGDDDEDIPF